MAGVAIVLGACAAAGLFYVGKALWRDAAPAEASAETKPRPAAGAERIDVLLQSAATYAMQGEHAKADAILREACGTHPTEQSLYLARADLLAGLRRLEEAYECYEKALAIGPRENRIEKKAGSIALLLGRTERAVEHYSAAQSADPGDADAALLLGQAQFRAGDFDEARASLVRAGRLAPERGIVWATLAEIAFRENKPHVASQHIAKARELEPRVTQWRLIEARVLNRLGEPQRALDLLIGLSEAERRDPAVLKLLGESLGLLRRPGDAATLFAEASAAAPGNADLALETALWFERAGESARAAEFAELAERLGHPQAKAVSARLREPK